MIAAIVLAALVGAQTEEARPASRYTSPSYQACMASSPSMADERACLRGEVDRGRLEVARLASETGTDQHGQALWSVWVQHECRAEYDLAQGGNSADMREMACLIEHQSERAAYLQRRGRW